MQKKENERPFVTATRSSCAGSPTEREVEVVAVSLPFYHGAQLTVDITLRSAFTCCGAPRTDAAIVNCAELVESERCRLVVALETGGRWSTETLGFEYMTSCRIIKCDQDLETLWSLHLRDRISVLLAHLNGTIRTVHHRKRHESVQHFARSDVTQVHLKCTTSNTREVKEKAQVTSNFLEILHGGGESVSTAVSRQQPNAQNSPTSSSRHTRAEFVRLAPQVVSTCRTEDMRLCVRRCRLERHTHTGLRLKQW